LDAFIIIKVDVIFNHALGFFKGWGRVRTQSFFFQVGKEAFHGSIVPTIAKARHGRGNGKIFGEESIAM
jgi:hypothetical protein